MAGRALIVVWSMVSYTTAEMRDSLTHSLLLGTAINGLAWGGHLNAEWLYLSHLRHCRGRSINWRILCKGNQSLILLGSELPKIVTRTGETSLGELSLENLRILKILMLFVEIRSFTTSANGMSVGLLKTVGDILPNHSVFNRNYHKKIETTNFNGAL